MRPPGFVMSTLLFFGLLSACGLNTTVDMNGGGIDAGVDSSVDSTVPDLTPDRTRVEDSCVAPTCASNACGSLSNPCEGEPTDCGDCTNGNPCTDNLCGAECVPLTCESAGFACGDYNDGCDSTIECGGCEAGNMCAAGQCCPDCSQFPGRCGAVPTDCGPIMCGCDSGTCVDGGCTCAPDRLEPNDSWDAASTFTGLAAGAPATNSGTLHTIGDEDVYYFQSEARGRMRFRADLSGDNDSSLRLSLYAGCRDNVHRYTCAEGMYFDEPGDPVLGFACRSATGADRTARAAVNNNCRGSSEAYVFVVVKSIEPGACGYSLAVQFDNR